MKTLRTLVCVIVMLIISLTGYGQTMVTGHVFAEVVESVSASSQSQSSFTIQRDNAGSIGFGQIEIKSAASASCSLILGKANLTDNNQHQISMETSASGTQSQDGNAINGYQSINLQCKPSDDMLDQSALSYSGNVNVVLAYN